MKRLTIVLVVTALGGCASAMQQNAEQQEELLRAAGFSMKTADTPEKHSYLRRLPLYEVGLRKTGKQPIYYYSDPNFCQCIYLGDESNYQAYRQLLTERHLRAGPVAVTPADMELEAGWRVLGSN